MITVRNLMKSHGRTLVLDEVIEMVGLDSVADQRLGTLSLGMKQRVGLAAALLGDPPVIILDEPANGLDPEGVHWLRHYLTGCAAEGRTVFVSSHLLSDMALYVDHLVVIGRECRFKTIRNTFAASPRRGSVLGAKAIVLAAVVAGVAVVLSVCSIASAVLVTGARGRGFAIDFEGGAALLAGTVVNCVLASAFASAVTCIVRHQVAAIIAVVLWFTAVEGTLIALFDGAGRWLPLSSTFNLITVEQDAAYLSPLLATIYSALLCVVIGAVGIARIVRADA